MDCDDRELLRRFRKNRDVDRFQPFLERYLSFVYQSGYRQVGNAVDAGDVTRAVFLAFAARARWLSRTTVLAGWFFRATRFASKKLVRGRKARPLIATESVLPTDLVLQDSLWSGVAPLLDSSLDRLSPKRRLAVLARFVLGWPLKDSARLLRLCPRRAEKRAIKGLRQLAAQLRKHRVVMTDQELSLLLAASVGSAPVPPDLQAQILNAAEGSVSRRPKLALARSILRAFAWAAWKERIKFATAMAATLTGLVAMLAVAVALLWHSGYLLPWLLVFGARMQVKGLPELAQPAKSWPAASSRVLPLANSVRTAGELYQPTNIWLLHLRFTPEQWAALKPTRVRPVPDLMHPDGTVELRNPKARRNGVAGALGFDYNWVRADLEVSGAMFTNVATRLRGNGTYLSSLYGPKQPYKIDLNKFDPAQEWAGVTTLDLLNAIEDRSYMSDALGYEVFRAAQVPAPRTAYAYLTVSAPGSFERKPLGVYVMVENVDANFAGEHFGSRKAPIFKPVTPDLFKDLGNDWSDYARIYDLKTKATAKQKRRLMDFARLVTHADDAGFARNVGEFLDLDEFARFLAALVLVGNYDSFLTYGQNYYMYLDPRTNRFGFIPWDLDQAWGSFPHFGTARDRERASIWHPWVGCNRFLERVLAVEEFKQFYRAALENLLRNTFVPAKLSSRIDQWAPVIRDAIAAESDFRLHLFDQAVSTNWLGGPRDGGEGPKRPVHQIKRYIVHRIQSVRDQLDGKSKGVILQRATD